VEEIVDFLKESRYDIRAEACKHVMNLTGSETGISTLLLSDKDVCSLLLRLLGDAEVVSTSATKALVNLTTHPRAQMTLVAKQSFWSSILELVLTAESEKNPEHSRVCLMLLNNMTTTEDGAARLMNGRLGEKYKGHDVKRLLELFLTRKEEDEKTLNYILPVVTNVTQIQDGRDLVLSNDFLFFRRILWSLSSKNEKIRKATIEIVRNCCFSKTHHKSLVRETQVVERILLPLIGPEKFDDVDEEDLEGLPELLKQRVEDEDLEREPVDSIRQDIIDSLLLLTDTKYGREALRLKKAYEVLKVYHCEEEVEETSELVFKVVERLLADEDPTEEELEEENKQIAELLNTSNVVPENKEENEKEVVYEID